jgi:asparagine synthase (glutamine-hydrolysing)
VFEGRGFCFGETIWILPEKSEDGGSFDGKDGALSIVFDGFLTNRSAAREALEREGAHLVSGTDGEIVLRSFARSGEISLDRLEGSFAFALHDERTGKTILARDPFGVKPLHFAKRDGRLAFASEMKALFAATPHRGPNKRAVLEWFLYGDVLPPETLFEGISSVPPGHLLEIDPARGAPRLRRYYDPTAQVDGAVHEAYARMSPSRFVDELDETIRASVASCMPEGKAGVLLSGGLDSALVLALARKNGEVVALNGSVGDDPAFDERPGAEDAARVLSVPLLFGTASEEDFLRELPTVVLRNEMPLWHTQLVSYHLIARRAGEKRIRVLLCGSTLGAMLGIAGGRHAAQRWMKPAERLLGLLPWKAIRALEKSIFELRGAPVQAPGFVNSVFAAAHLIDGHAREVLMGRCERAYSFLTKASERGIQATRLSDLALLRPRFFHRADRLGMAVSAEHRDPMQDTASIRRSIHYPLAFLLRGGTNKWALKQVASRYLPARIVHKKKIAWALPEARYLAPLARSDLFRNGFCADFLRLDADAIGDFARLHRRNPDSFFHLVGLETWGRLFHKGETAEDAAGLLIGRSARGGGGAAPRETTRDGNRSGGER